MSNELKKTIESCRGIYLEQWSKGNAQKFEDDQNYMWMSNHIDGYQKILEIGCGDGRATLELAKRGHFIISIDENPICLEAAKSRLEENNFSVVYLNRASVTYQKSNNILNIGGYRYSIDYESIDLLLDPKINVYLIEGDVLSDKGLFDWLQNIEKFDAVICWLIGTNGAKIFNNNIDFWYVPTPADYRLAVQNEVYKLANVILRNGGILNIVDRMQKPATVVFENCFVSSQIEQARATSLIVCGKIHYQSYRNPDNGYDIDMVSLQDQPIQNTNTVLSSIASKKYK